MQELPVLGRTLVVGRRTNVLLGNDSLLYLPENVTLAARQRGKLFQENAEDYFFISFNDFPWHLVADVVVGRPAYDNYLVALAIQHNVTVVDATATLLAVHQSDKEGNFAGHANKDSAFNAVRIGKFDYYSGFTTSAQYVTKFIIDKIGNRTKVTVESRYRSQLTPAVETTPPITRRATDGMPKSTTFYHSSVPTLKLPNTISSAGSELTRPHTNKTGQVLH